MDNPDPMVMILGTCTHGPFRYVQDSLVNPDVKWLSWGYHTAHIHDRVVEDLRARDIRHGTPVLFASWDIDRDTIAKPLRFGTIDYIGNYGDYVIFTVFLGEFANEAAHVVLSDSPRILCRYERVLVGSRAHSQADLLPGR